MSLSRFLPVLVAVGLLSLLITLAIALAQSGDTVAIMDSDADDVSGTLSDMATISILNVPALGADQVYEGWFVSDDRSRKQSTGILTVTNGTIDQTFWLVQDAQSVTITLDEQNDSGQSGTATLTAKGGDTEVVLSLTAGALETELVHIHTGSCGANLGGVAHPLSSFVGGSGGSETLLSGVGLGSLMTENFAVNSHQAGNPGVYTACGNIPSAGATGENLFADFDTFVVTIEPADDPDPGPSDVAAYSHTIPTGGIVHIRHLLYSWSGNPPYVAGFHKGTEKGIAVGLREQTADALKHAGFAVGSANIEGLQIHAQHVVNIIQGFGGGNFDPRTYFGDGFGVLNYASDTALHANLAGTAAASDPVISTHGSQAVASANEVADWANDAVSHVLLAMATDDLAGAQLTIGNAEALLSNAFDSSVDAYVAAQSMGQYSLLPVVADVDGPKVGDPYVPNVALATLIAGALLLLMGIYIYRRSKSSV